MEPTQAPPTPTMPKPTLWRYVLVFVLLTILWVVLCELWIHPKILAPGVSMKVRALGYLLPPFALTALVYLLHSLVLWNRHQKQVEQQAAEQQAAERQIKEEEARRAAVLALKRFSLEVLALGISVEYLRQAEVWEEIQSLESADLILSSEAADYPSTIEDKERRFREREAEVLGRALRWITSEWSIPTFLVGPELQNPMMAGLLESNLTEALAHAGVPRTAMKVVDTLHDQAPETILQTIFDFLERNANVPAVLLVAEDGAALRDALRAEDSYPELHKGPRRPEDMTESVVAFVLGSKDRIEPMRKFVQPEPGGKDVMTPFWEKEKAKRPAGDYVASEWMPVVWTNTLLKGFTKLTVLGHLHRPQYVSFQGEAGPKGPASKTAAFSEGWQAMLDGRKNEDKLAHLFFEHGSVEHGRRLAPLSMTFASLQPDWDPIDQGINLNRYLGDTGSNAPFVGLALAVIASFREGGMSVFTHLRMEDRASLLMVTEPTERAEVEDGADPLEVET